jgi:IclR family acetate operon transcriptional repressor
MKTPIPGAADPAADDRLGQVQSLVRAFGLLEALAAKPDGMTLTEVAREVGLARSTAHRLLTTMEAMRFVRFATENNRWSVGVQAFAVGAAFAGPRDLSKLARPIMRSINVALDEVVNICVLRQHEIVCVDQVRSDAGGAPLKPGARLPAFASASGKAWLAHSDTALIDSILSRDPIRPRTRHGLRDMGALMDDLNRARSRGYAVDDQEFALGLRCVAATVFNEDGKPHATLSISGPAEQLTAERVVEAGLRLGEAARRMTASIGGRYAA